MAGLACFTTEQIMLGTGWARSTVYWYAHTHRWHRARGVRPTAYLASDVLETLSRQSATMAERVMAGTPFGG